MFLGTQLWPVDWYHFLNSVNFDSRPRITEALRPARTCHIEQKIQFLQNGAATVEHGRPAVSDREDKLS
jgi:hypothetical protein